MRRSEIMARVKSRDTGPELRVAESLRALGVEYERDVRHLPGRPDFVIPSAAVALFVHGCFWHGHECARGSRVPKSNRKYWVAKIARNQRRDRRVARALRLLGFSVWVVWECRLREGMPNRTCGGILRRLAGDRSAP